MNRHTATRMPDAMLEATTTTINLYSSLDRSLQYWPLWRFDPAADRDGHPLRLDSKPPSIPVSQFTMQEARFAMLARVNPDRAAELLERAQRDVDERWHLYEQMAGVERGVDRQEEAES